MPDGLEEVEKKVRLDAFVAVDGAAELDAFFVEISTSSRYTMGFESAMGNSVRLYLGT